MFPRWGDNHQNERFIMPNLLYKILGANGGMTMPGKLTHDGFQNHIVQLPGVLVGFGRNAFTITPMNQLLQRDGNIFMFTFS